MNLISLLIYSRFLSILVVNFKVDVIYTIYAMAVVTKKLRISFKLDNLGENCYVFSLYRIY